MPATLRRILLLAALFASAASFVSCAPTAKRHRYTGTAMGCAVSITVDDDDDERARTAARAAQEELDRLDQALSDWKRSSELSAINGARELRTEASDDLRAVLARALDVAEATDCLFDPTVGPLVRLWRESRKSGKLPADGAIAVAKRSVGPGMARVEGTRVVRRRADVTLDFGGIGKGYGAVRAVAALRAAGCPRALVAVAGDIAAGDAPRGEAGWTVSISSESEAAQASEDRIALVHGAISTSGGSEQWVAIAGTRYAHIVDPRTGLGATALAQVTVVGPLDCAVDALGTGLALCGDDSEIAAIMAKFPGFRARVERGGRAKWIPAADSAGRPESR